MYEFNTTEPIYIQMIDIFKQKIVSGEWQRGSRTPTVRDLAIEYGINPNTVQRSLSELEREGLMYCERTSGRYITSDESLIKKEKERIAQKEVDGFMKRMSAVGCSKDEIIDFVRNYNS